MNEERMRRLAEAMSGANDDTSEGTVTGVLKSSEPEKKEGLPIIRINNPFDEDAMRQRGAERFLKGYPTPVAPVIESPLFDAAFAQYATGGTFFELTRQRVRGGENYIEAINNDNKWSPSSEEIRAVADRYQLPNSWMGRLSEARSPEDLERVAQVGSHRTQRQADINNSRGLGAEATKFVAAAADPVFLVAGFGAGTIARVGQASTRMGNALRASASAIAVDAPLETFRVYDDPDVTPLDAGIAVMASGILSSVLGGALGRSMNPSEIKEMEEQLASLVEQDYGSSVGAKQLNPIFRELDDGTVEPIDAPDQQIPRWSSPSTWFAWGVPVQKMQQSSSPTVRKLAERLSWNPQIKGNQGTTAFEVARRITEGTSSFARPYKQAEKAFYDGGGVFGGTNTEQRREFGRIVWRHINGVAKSEDPNVLKAAEALSNMQLEALAYAQSRAYSGGDAKLAQEINTRVHQRLEQEAKARQAAAEGKGAGDAAEAGVPAKEPKKNPYMGRKSFRGAEENRGPKPNVDERSLAAARSRDEQLAKIAELEAKMPSPEELPKLTKAKLIELYNELGGDAVPSMSMKKDTLLTMVRGVIPNRKRTVRKAYDSAVSDAGAGNKLQRIEEGTLGDGSLLRAMIDNANTDAVQRRLDAEKVDPGFTGSRAEADAKSADQISNAANQQSMARAFEALEGNTPRALMWAREGDSRGLRIINQNMKLAREARSQYLENPNNPLDEVLARWSDDLPDANKVRLAEEAHVARSSDAPDGTPPNAGPPGPDYPHVVRHEDGQEWGFKTREEAEEFANDGNPPARDEIDDAVDKIAEQLVEYDGFDAVKNLVHSPDYLPRRFSVDGIQNYRKTRSDEDIIQTLGAAIARANPERFGEDAGKAMTVAKHYWETVLDVYIRQDDGPRFAKKTFQDRAAARQEVLDILEKQGKKPDDIAEEAMDLIIEQLAPLQRAVSESSRAKPRMKLDLNSEWSKGLDEIFEQDALDLALDYSRTMAGYAALNRAGFNSIAELNKMISQAAKELDKDVDLKATADTLDELRFWRDSILGQPSEELAKSPKVSWLASQARRVNFAAYMSNVAFAAVSEIAGHAMRVGVFNYMGQFARYRGYMKRARKGDLTMADDVFATADIVMGHGTGMLRAELAQRTQRYDFDFPETDPGFNRGRDVAERIDTGTRKAANVVSRLSAMAPLQQFMRMTYVSAMADHLVKKAAKGGMPFSKRRMETMGITEEMWGRISAELNNSGKVISPDTNREVPMIRHQDWKDREAADAFINWIDRDSRRMILEGDVGHSPRFLREKPMLALMFQFLSFPINAWTKHSGYLGSVKDGRAFAEMLVMATGGMVGVQARTFLQGAAIEDEERRAKFFEERLNPLEVAKSAFYYSAHASLIPNIYDTAIGTARSFVGEEVLPNELSFSYTRNSGLASSFLTGNPTVATIDRAAKVLPSFFDEDGATKQDVQKAIKLLPFGNHVASIAVSEHLLSVLPEEDVN